jgi:hypothetical protein
MTEAGRSRRAARSSVVLVMVRRIPVCFAIGVVLFVHATAASACFAPRDAKPTSSETHVALKTALDRPHYYFVIENVVVFIPPVKVVTFNDVCSGGRRISYDNNGAEDPVGGTLDWIS